MKKVFQLLNKAAPVKQDVGIEIEVEGKNLHEVFKGGWRTEDDGSLRGAYPESRAEYILDTPIKIDEVEEKLEFLRKDLENATFDFSFRTSVHVHVNVQDLTEVEVMNMVYTYLLLEEPLVNFCGRERKGNRFCLRIADAEGIMTHFSKMFSKGLRYIMAVNPNDLRYSGINLASLAKYGTVEFRSMRGCIDVETLTIWAHSLMAIREYAKAKKVPMDIMQEFSKGTPRDFLRTVLGKYAVYYEYPRMTKEVQRSYSLSLELPYMYKEPEAPVDYIDLVGKKFQALEPVPRVQTEVGKYATAKTGVKILDARLRADGKVEVFFNKVWQNWGGADDKIKQMIIQRDLLAQEIM